MSDNFQFARDFKNVEGRTYATFKEVHQGEVHLIYDDETEVGVGASAEVTLGLMESIDDLAAVKILGRYNDAVRRNNDNSLSFIPDDTISRGVGSPGVSKIH